MTKLSKFSEMKNVIVGMNYATDKNIECHHVEVINSKVIERSTNE